MVLSDLPLQFFFFFLQLHNLIALFLVFGVFLLLFFFYFFQVLSHHFEHVGCLDFSFHVFDCYLGACLVYTDKLRINLVHTHNHTKL